MNKDFLNPAYICRQEKGRVYEWKEQDPGKAIRLSVIKLISLCFALYYVDASYVPERALQRDNKLLIEIWGSFERIWQCNMANLFYHFNWEGNSDKADNVYTKPYARDKLTLQVVNTMHMF